jgi:hypothetical protein
MRALVLFLVLLACGALPDVGMSEAQAAISCTSTNPAACDKGAAYQDCSAHLSAQAASTPTGYTFQNRGCTDVVRNGYPAWQSDCDIKRNSDGMVYAHGCPTWSYYYACPADRPWDEATKTCAKDCSAEPDMEGYKTPGDGTACVDGCEYADLLDAEQEGYWIAPTGATCTVSEDNEPVNTTNDADNDGTPDVDDAFPEDPSEQKDSDGDGVGDNADTAPNDPDNGQDDGTGDETDNTASGGGTCDAAPQCSGDAIQCAQLHQTWLMRCKLGASVTGDPTVCAASYTCAGDTAQCAQVALLRVQACKDPQTQANTGDANNNGVADILEAGVDSVEGIQPGLGEGDGGAGLWGKVNQNGWLGGGSCPGVPTFTAFGRTFNLSEKPCEQGALLGNLLFAFALTAAAFIIGRAASGT